MTKESRAWLLLLLGLALVHGLVYAAVIPPWQGPDETGHFEYAWLLARLARVPTKEDLYAPLEQEMLASLYEWRYGEFIGRPLPARMPTRMEGLPKSVFAYYTRPVTIERFSLAYLWQALYLLPFRSQDLVFQLYVARLSSIVLNVGIVWLAFLTLWQLFPSHPNLIALATSIVVFLPQHTFINSMVGEGPLAELMSCLVLYCWVSIFRQGLTPWRVIAIVLGTLIGVWTKNTVAFLIPVDIGLALWWLWRQARQTWTWREVIYLCTGLVLLGFGLWIWSRSVLGIRSLSALELLASLKPAWKDTQGTSLGAGLLLTYDSFWANFGWMALPIGERWYGAVMVLSLLSLVGWGTKTRDGEPVPSWALGIMAGDFLAAALFFVGGGLLIQSYYWIQGRYLFPVTIPYSFLLIGGLDRLLHLRSNRATLLAVVLFLIVLDSWCLFGVIIPYYYA